MMGHPYGNLYVFRVMNCFKQYILSSIVMCYKLTSLSEQLGGCLLMCTSSNLVSVAFEFLLLRSKYSSFVSSLLAFYFTVQLR